MRRQVLRIAAIAAVYLASLADAQAQQNLRDVFTQLGDPAGFLSNNQQRFKFELDAIEHRFISVFGGVCEVAAADGDKKKKPADPPKPPEPPKPPPKPPEPPEAKPPEDGGGGESVITKAAPRAKPEQGEIVGIDLLDANTERAISVNGFDPFNEQQIRSEFQETRLDLGGGDDGGNDDDNNDNNDDGGNNNNDDDGGNDDVNVFTPDQIVINAGAPPSQVEVYFNPETGELSPVDVPGSFSIGIGFDAPDLGFVFGDDGIRIINPAVGNGSAPLPVGRRVRVTINVPGFGRRVLAFTANANFTIRVESIR